MRISISGQLFLCILVNALGTTLVHAQKHQIEFVVKLPEGIKVEQLFLAGSFNGWNPADSNWLLRAGEDGNFQLRQELDPGRHEYKYTQGSWSSVERDADGFDIQNRKLQVDGNASEHMQQDEIVRFESAKAPPAEHPNPRISYHEILIENLQRERSIRIYLPPDYEESNKSYPVLYMQDAQNLFDQRLSIGGEWGIDESLDSLFEQGFEVPIVVGIDHGAGKRLDEYSFFEGNYINQADGKAYANFIVTQLKPWIDENYRTLPNPENTAIMGSSMGGLISLLSCLEHPDVFGMSGVFSPALQLSPENWTYLDEVELSQKSKFYFAVGEKEQIPLTPFNTEIGDYRLSAFALNTLEGFNRLQRRGLGEDQLICIVRPGRVHNEAFWKNEFPIALKWLFHE
jgi:predicted alpha/beta superfamily hydrolase